MKSFKLVSLLPLFALSAACDGDTGGDNPSTSTSSGAGASGSTSSSSGSSSGGGGASTSTTSTGGATTGTGGAGATAQGGGGASTGGVGGVGTGGTGGSTTSQGGGGSGGCSSALECPGTDTECHTRTCVNQVCGTSYAAPGTVLSTQTPGDCLVMQCDGNGNPVAIPDDTDVMSDGLECTTDSCNNGTPVHTSVPVGTACAQNSGTVCDGNGNCVGCNSGADCTSHICTNNTCLPASCADGAKNGSETDVDCGGDVCGKCADNLACIVAADCVSGVCTGQVCQPPLCTDTVKNGAETDVDCGGGCPTLCGVGQGCAVDGDCITASCSGTICLPTCTDGLKDGNESDIDCGGGTCAGCAPGLACLAPSDCSSGVCTGGICQTASCIDTVKNGSETDVDCGGGTCPKCATGLACSGDADCLSQLCTNGVCAPNCFDTVVHPSTGVNATTNMAKGSDNGTTCGSLTACVWEAAFDADHTYVYLSPAAPVPPGYHTVAYDSTAPAVPVTTVTVHVWAAQPTGTGTLQINLYDKATGTPVKIGTGPLHTLTPTYAEYTDTFTVTVASAKTLQTRQTFDTLTGKYSQVYIDFMQCY